MMIVTSANITTCNIYALHDTIKDTEELQHII